MQAGSLLVDKGNYRHYMAKEIHEQPEVVGRTLAHYLDLASGTARLPFELAFDPKALSRVTISACGTAYYAGLVARYWLERFARLSVDIDIASEFRYREAPLPENGLMIVVSQSGETADTLAALRYAKAHGQHVLSIVNVETSTIARESETVAPTLAGPEIGVASTKAFTCQLAVFACLALALGRARGVLTEAREKELVAELIATPGLMARVLKDEARIEPVARDVARASSVLYLGRGPSYPLALEGALKLKELSYIHAEGYAAGELKHGPIALIDFAIPVIVLAPHDASLEKTVSNLQEVAARGGHLILIGPESARVAASAELAGFIEMPEVAGGRLRRAGLRRAGAAARLSRRGFHGQGRGSAAKFGEKRDGGVAALKLCVMAALTNSMTPGARPAPLPKRRAGAMRIASASSWLASSPARGARLRARQPAVVLPMALEAIRRRRRAIPHC